MMPLATPITGFDSAAHRRCKAQMHRGLAASG